MFKDKVIIITGSTQGIGYKTAEMLAQRGARLVINSRSQQKVDFALARLRLAHPNVTGLAGDVSDYHFCRQLRQLALDTFGQIDILINNAGIASSGLIKDTLPEAFEKVVDINFLGSLHPTLACVDEICRQKGSILFIGSVAGILGLPNYSAYSATKRAIVSLAESLRSELADDGVFVGINYPGFTENDEQKTIFNANGQEEILKKRSGVKVVKLEKTVGTIVRQLEKQKFRMYSSYSAEAIQWIYRLFPQLTLNLLRHFRHKISSMQ